MKIVGLGSYVPEIVIPNETFEVKVDTPKNWIYDKLGIKERRVVNVSQFSSDLAVHSSLNAIKDAGLTVEDIDFTIFCTSTPDKLSPSTACILQDKIKLINSACVDINAVCCGFLYGLQMAKGLLSLNQYKNILVVASETYSHITDYQHRDCVFFGDGSGAVVVQKDNSNLCEIQLYSNGSGKEGFSCEIGGKYKMNGKEVYKNGIEKLPQSIIKLLNDLHIYKVDHVVPHQPSVKILQETARILNLNFNIFGLTMDKYANTAGASIPITMDDMYKKGKFKKGDNLLLTAIGSGWVWGSGIISWTK